MIELVDRRDPREKRLAYELSLYSGGVVGSETGPCRLALLSLLVMVSMPSSPFKRRSCSSSNRSCSSAIRFAEWMSSMSFCLVLCRKNKLTGHTQESKA